MEGNAGSLEGVNSPTIEDVSLGDSDLALFQALFPSAPDTPSFPSDAHFFSHSLFLFLWK